MGESELSTDVSRVVADEAALGELAAQLAARWRGVRHERAMLLGLQGELGAGKTAWVRAMLRGLGYAGRVPSPTYTLMEIYEIDSITLIHMDLYRINGDDDLASLGVRDWLARPGVWLFVEWPERAPALFAQCDVLLTIDVLSAQARRLCCSARSPAANAWLAPFELT